jgi:hypothetical protein
MATVLLAREKRPACEVLAGVWSDSGTTAGRARSAVAVAGVTSEGDRLGGWSFRGRLL